MVTRRILVVAAVAVMAAVCNCQQLPPAESPLPPDEPQASETDAPEVNTPEVDDQDTYIPGQEVEIVLDANQAYINRRTVSAVTGEPLGVYPAWIPTSPGADFSGWYYDPECTSPFDVENDIIKGSMILYAGYVRRIKLVDKGKVARVTGNSLSGETLPNPNYTCSKYNLGGTDLGIIWEMSDGTYGIAFGDSYGSDFKPVGGGPGGASDWRSNVLAYSQSTDFTRGLVFSGMMMDTSRPYRAAPIIVRENYRAFTYIPTGAICLDGVEFVHYMYWEVMDRSHAYENYSSYCMSLDAGKTWINCRSRIKFPSESYFCMVGMARPEGSPYCYLLGTQSGNGYRLSAARLARVKPSDILDRDKYEYWNGTRRRWLKGSESLATDLLEARIGELSFMYNEKYGRWIVMYIDNTLGICYRTAPSVIGPWSDEKVLCPSSDSRYKGVYGSFMHPACMKADWDGDLYWTMSQWGPYNVFLMRASISYE